MATENDKKKKEDLEENPPLDRESPPEGYRKATPEEREPEKSKKEDR
jgi:hypothetical protein